MDLVTWNIQWGKGCDGVVDLKRIVDTMRKLADADVFCLQEIAINFPALDEGKAEDQPATFAALLPGYQVVFRPAVDYRGLDGTRRQFGNMVLSRLPVLQVLPFLLPRPADAVRSMQRIALEVVVQDAPGPVRVTTTHVEYYSAAHQTAQVAALRSLHQEAAQRVLHPAKPVDDEGTYRTVPRPASAIVTGDFNFEPSNPSYAAMLAPFTDGTPAFRDAWTVAHPGQPHAPTCGIGDRELWKQGPHCRDFIFVSEDLAPRVRDVRVDVETTASDHQPVHLKLA
ncbi:MAG: endonuclease/exonuclease/phosphatase family protein [Proteobacteria bacterium]|nr:endonuclease/exonuclease/phosphatase family protein [Pseudomonadota bacterium]